MSEHLPIEMGTATAQGASRPQRKYSAKDRKRLLRLFESRDVSQKQFARDQSIPISTLSYWVRRSTRESEVTPGAVVEISGKKVAAAKAGQSLQQPAKGVDIRLPNQLQVRVSAGTDAQWVVELLQGLLTCSG